MAKVKRPIKKAARETQRPLSLEPTPLTAETMERWHKEIARVAGKLALTLARRRRSPDLVDDIVNALSPVLEEARTHQ